ncbi:uncharacterized protein LOC122557558 [Chiloscyllium plagiosum]|uniref:uncharacterized protein LOC122557558 n=1 Tax=Chiloscyllium plagiosum TaxID=36176 RepID=UPI001CB883E7|nr:uncharacterized protein LOC122557558 [Chiloscyllium plagiosum]
MAHQVTSPALSSPEETTTVDFPTAYVDQNYTHPSMLPKERSLSDMTVKDDCDFALIQKESPSSQELRPKVETVPRRYLKVVKQRPSVICFSKNCFTFLNNNDIDEKLYVVETHPDLTAEVFQIKQKNLSNTHIKDNPILVRDILDENVSDVLGQQHNLENRISRSQSCPVSFKEQRHDTEDSNNSSLQMVRDWNASPERVLERQIKLWLSRRGMDKHVKRENTMQGYGRVLEVYEWLGSSCREPVWI